MTSEEKAFAEWKVVEFDTRLFKDVYATVRQQRVADTISGVHAVASVSSQGMFGNKKSALDTPRLNSGKKFTP